MIDELIIQYFTSLPAVAPAGPASVPAISYNMPSDAEYRSHLNVSALDAAVPDDDEFGGRENANRCAQILAPLVRALKYYAGQGKSPVRVQSVSVVGRLYGDMWVFFLPASGLVMRCDDSLSIGSQVFEPEPAYLAAAQTMVNDGEEFHVVPWQLRDCFLSSSLDTSIPPRPAFWALHVKTAEVI